MAIVLYDISWSHFCEKSRFCLDFKGLPYRIETVNPYTRRQAIRAGGRGRAHTRRQRTPWLSGDPPPGYPLPVDSRP